MKVLVTGGAGFLGGHVARAVRAAGHEVVIFDQVSTDGLPTIQGDLLDPASVNNAVQRVDAICHLGAVGDVYLAFERPMLAAQVNVVGTANIMEAAMQAGSRKVVYASTWEVYGEPRYQPIDEHHPTNPDHPYNITKLAGELLALSYDKLKGVPTIALRLGTAYGTGMRPNSVFSIFVDKAARGEPITVSGSGQQGRQFTHASDIGAAFVRALELDVHGYAFNIVGDELITIRDLAEAVVQRLPAKVTYGEARIGDVPSAIVSNQRAREVLGWEPRVAFTDGLDELIAWRLAQTERKAVMS
jgi:UDP-glucose 4-epimerase